MSFCCENCFDDKFLKDYITRHGSFGCCDYCRPSGVFCICISVSSLTGLFDPIVDLYEPLERGKHYIDEDDLYGIGNPLTELLNGDWEIFSDKLIDAWGEDKLIDDIINSTRKPKDSIDTGGLWVPKDQAFTYSLPEERWDEFAHYIKRERRFVLSLPKYKDPSRWLQHRLLIAEFTMPEGSHLFRARRGYKSNEKGKKCPFDLDEMGPPKPEETKGGRANPPGIPFLYVALDQETAVAEIRPWKGAIVSVARLVLLKETPIINLANIPPLKLLSGSKTSIGY
jgi:hypothetical protein